MTPKNTDAEVVEKGDPIGNCPVCGIVHGEDVEFNFPNDAYCSCGRRLDEARIAPSDVVIT